MIDYNCKTWFDELLSTYMPDTYWAYFKFKCVRRAERNFILQQMMECLENQKKIETFQTEIMNFTKERELFQQEQASQKQVIQEQTSQIQRLEYSTKKSICLVSSLRQIKQSWINYHIQELNNSSYGAGVFYEMHVLRKQEAIENFLCLNESELTSDDIELIKKETDYQENFEPYTEVDEETGQTLDVYAIARRLNGEEF